MKRLILLLPLLFLACSSGPEIAGSGSESSNAMTGATVRLPGSYSTTSKAIPVDNALVSLYSVAEISADTSAPRYVWSLADSIRTDASGAFSLINPSPGHFAVLFEKDSLKAFSGYFIYKGDTLDLGSLILTPALNLGGSLIDSLGQPVSGVALGLVGTSFLDTTASDGRFSFTRVPEGIYNFSLLFQTLRSPKGDSIFLNTAAPVSAPVSPAAIDTSSWGIVNADTVGFDQDTRSLSVSWALPLNAASFVMLPDSVRLSLSPYRISYTVVKP